MGSEWVLLHKHPAAGSADATKACVSDWTTAVEVPTGGFSGSKSRRVGASLISEPFRINQLTVMEEAN